MKHAKAHPTLLYTYGFFVLILSLLFIEFATSYVIKAYFLHWLILASVLTLCFSPLGNKKLIANRHEKPRYPLWSWLTRLFALQLSLFLVFIGMLLVPAHWLLLSFTIQPLTINPLTTTLLKQYALLPWAIYALYAGGFSYISYIENQDAYASNLVSPLFKQKSASLFSIALNLQARSAVFMVLATTFAFMTLLMATTVTPRAIPLLTGFHIKTLIIIFILILAGFTPPFKKVIKNLLNPKLPLPVTTATTLILFALLIWSLNAFFGEIGEKPIKVPDLIQWFERKNAVKLWLIFSAGWWIGWTPLIAGHIARLSRGYRIRSVFLATLTLPFLSTILIIWFPETLSIFQDYPIISSLLSIIAFFYLLALLTEKTALPMMIRSYLPKRDSYKRRDHYFYFRKLFQVMLVVIYLYLPAGIAITVFMTFMLTLSFTLQVPFAIITLLKKFNN